MNVDNYGIFGYSMPSSSREGSVMPATDFCDLRNPNRTQDINVATVMSAQHTCFLCGKNNVIENWLLGADGVKIDPVVWTAVEGGLLKEGGAKFTFGSICVFCMPYFHD